MKPDDIVALVILGLLVVGLVVVLVCSWKWNDWDDMHDDMY